MWSGLANGYLVIRLLLHFFAEYVPCYHGLINKLAQIDLTFSFGKDNFECRWSCSSLKPKASKWISTWNRGVLSPTGQRNLVKDDAWGQAGQCASHRRHRYKLSKYLWPFFKASPGAYLFLRKLVFTGGALGCAPGCDAGSREFETPTGQTLRVFK